MIVDTDEIKKRIREKYATFAVTIDEMASDRAAIAAFCRAEQRELSELDPLDQVESLAREYTNQDVMDRNRQAIRFAYAFILCHTPEGNATETMAFEGDGGPGPEQIARALETCFGFKNEKEG